MQGTSGFLVGVCACKKKSLFHLSVTLFVFFLTFYFGFSAVTGRRGLLALVSLKKDIECNKSLLKSIFFEKEKLSNKILGLYEKSLDLDLLDEQAKNTLGYVNRSEFMVIISTE